MMLAGMKGTLLRRRHPRLDAFYVGPDSIRVGSGGRSRPRGTEAWRACIRARSVTYLPAEAALTKAPVQIPAPAPLIC
jgi:hypothetical protein